MKSFEDVCAYAHAAELIVLVDAKRGDIGSTARAYASAYLEPRDGDRPVGDAITVHTYLGRESLEPFLKSARRNGAGIFCVLKTSNAGGDVQDLKLSDGRPLWHQVAELIASWGEDLLGDCGLSSVGAVVGATHPREVGEARRLLPQAPILLPGVGAQGATPADVARAFTSGPASALVSVSRSLIYAFRLLRPRLADGDRRRSRTAPARGLGYLGVVATWAHTSGGHRWRATERRLRSWPRRRLPCSSSAPA